MFVSDRNSVNNAPSDLRRSQRWAGRSSSEVKRFTCVRKQLLRAVDHVTALSQTLKEPVKAARFNPRQSPSLENIP